MQPNSEKCKGCGELIDPDVCWCGQSINHGYDNHPIIPMGCNCYRNAADDDYASTPHPSAYYDDVKRSTYYGSSNE